MAAWRSGTATLLNPSEGPPVLPPVHILPPSSTIATPTPIPVVVPSLSPTTDPCGDSVLQPAIFSPTATSVPGVARPVRSGHGGVMVNHGDHGDVKVYQGGHGEVKVKDLDDLLRELSLQSEESLLVYVQEGLRKAAKSVKDDLQDGTGEDIQQKMELMGDWWQAGKLSSTVKSQLGSLVGALNKGEMAEAHDLHLGLMSNHTAEVKQWLTMVKKIIQELQSKATGSQVSHNEGGVQKTVTEPHAVPHKDGHPDSSSSPKTAHALSSQLSNSCTSLSPHLTHTDVTKGGS